MYKGCKEGKESQLGLNYKNFSHITMETKVCSLLYRWTDRQSGDW
jgi:hypothetical protein